MDVQHISVNRRTVEWVDHVSRYTTGQEAERRVEDKSKLEGYDELTGCVCVKWCAWTLVLTG